MEGRHASPSHAAPDRDNGRSAYSAGSRSSGRTYSAEEYEYRRPAASREASEYEEQRTARVRPREYDEDYSSPRRSRVAAEGYEEDYGSRASRSRSSGEDYGYSRGGSGRQTGNAAGRSAGRPVKQPEAKGFEFGDIVKIILLTGLVLVVFATFHHVLPQITAKNQVYEPISTAPPAVAAPSPTPGFGQESVPQDEETDPAEQPVEPEVIDNRTEWQKKFEDKFTDEVVETGSSYTSPNISINIETVSTQINGYNQTYYVADIYVASIDCFRTYFAYNKYQYYGAEPVSTISKNAGAILSVNGDYCNNQQSGFLVRNGETWFNDPSTFDICVLFNDGTMETFAPGSYEPQQLLDRGVWQSWKFGPMLLDQNGNEATSFNTSQTIISEPAPRTGIGYFEPGHYCFIVADGRQGNYARGLTLQEFAQIFKDLGCVRAYNLDGGASAVMSFKGGVYNQQSSPRDLGEIALIKEPETVAEEAGE